MRTTLGWVVTAVAVLCALAGLAVMVVLGPDSRFTTGPHAVDTDGIAVVTAPKVITWKGLQVDILAEVPVNKPVFVGIGNSVDVQNYVGKTQRLEVTDFSTPWTVKTRERDGQVGLPGAPTAIDWWIAHSAGLGGASISTQLPDETVSAAVLAVGATNLRGLKVSFAYGVKGGFAQGAGLLLLGVGGVWGGTLVRRSVGQSEEWDDGDEELVEEVVYVYVDEHGVEHEITEEEAAEIEAAQDEEGEDEEGENEEVPAEEVPAEEVPASPQVPPERVVYVFVDEDGVEHEVGEDELDEFELVEEPATDADSEDRT